MKKIIIIFIVLFILVINLFADVTVTCKFLARGRNMNIDYTLKCHDGVSYSYYNGYDISINTTTVTSVDVEIEEGYSPVLLEAVESNSTFPVFQMTTFNPLPYGGWVSNILEVNANAVYLRLKALDTDVTAEYTLYCSDNSAYSDYNINLSTSNITLVYVPINANTYPTSLEVHGYSTCGHSPLTITDEFQFGEVPEIPGSFDYWWNGHYSSNVWQPLYIQGYPYINAIFNIYSNIDIDDATITYSYEPALRIDVTVIQDLKKGWNAIEFNDVCICNAEAEATATGVGNPNAETYTLTTTNDFIYNSTTGYYENSDIEFCFENKPLHDDWNWESFPMMTINSTTNNGDTNMPLLLTAGITPPGYSELYVEGQDENLVYESYTWSPFNYVICSSDGVKINLENPSENKIYTAAGTCVLESTPINLEAGEWNWIGYWLPHSEMSNVAFGDDWDKVTQLKSEDWYYQKKNNIRGEINEPITWTPKPLHYGEGYMVYVSESISGFSWTSSSEKSENFNKPESENFVFEKKADYEVIDVLNIDPSIIEIGVFADDVCVGAVVVEDSCEQILVYSDNANRDPIPFNFEIVTSRGSSSAIKNYKVYNKNTGDFENGVVVSGSQIHSMVMLGEEIEQEEDIPGIIELNGNYPNPFNPTTTISFNVTRNSVFVNLSIYNLKGQKVKHLVSEQLSEGQHSVVWNGKNDNNGSVSSGIYFYKFKTGDKEISRKMILMK